jgi:hypothetical protein
MTMPTPTLSALIDEYVDLKIEGEPAASDWRSRDDNARDRDAYYERLQNLRDQIDACVAT